MDVWEDSTSGDGGVSHKFGEFLVVSDSKLDVSWDDSASSVVSGGVTCELEDLSGDGHLILIWRRRNFRSA